jgi:hypothetical protein
MAFIMHALTSLFPVGGRESFHPKVEGMDSVLGVAMLDMFFNDRCLALSNAHDVELNANSNKAFLEVSGKIVADLADGEELSRAPQ